MTNDRPAWPNEHINLDAASRWIAFACTGEISKPEILRSEHWSVTACSGSVVFKASFTSLFPQVVNVQVLPARIVPEGAPRRIASEMAEPVQQAGVCA